MARAVSREVVEAARVIEQLTGVPPTLHLPRRRPTRADRERVERFLALPAELQEGALRYAERVRDAFAARES
ncbi:MAG: hypothetical protein ACOC58_00115 [Chloroflexota bacterium]